MSRATSGSHDRPHATRTGGPKQTRRHNFTGKERDAESGNDYFGARYYASTMGRFLSPDWSKNPQGVPYADYTNPQTLNLYSYMRNNPLSGTDPDGHCCWDNIKTFLSGMKDVAVGMWDDAFHSSPQGTVTTTQTFNLSLGTVAALSTAVVQQGLQQSSDDSTNQALDVRFQ